MANNIQTNTNLDAASQSISSGNEGNTIATGMAIINDGMKVYGVSRRYPNKNNRTNSWYEVDIRIFDA
jgi:hypothetical protein